MSLVMSELTGKQKTVLHCSTPTSSPNFGSQSSFIPGRMQRTHRFMRIRVHATAHWTHRTSRRHKSRTALEASRVHIAWIHCTNILKLIF